jgi:hypothetical protein
LCVDYSVLILDTPRRLAITRSLEIYATIDVLRVVVECD